MANKEFKILGISSKDVKKWAFDWGQKSMTSGVNPAYFAASGSLMANWFGAGKKIAQYKVYKDIPEVNTPVNYKATCMAGMDIWVEDLKTGKKLPDHELQKLINKPNPLQAKSEFWEQAQRNFEIFGNGYIYTPLRFGFQNVSAKNVYTMWVLPSLDVTPKTTRKLYGQSKESEIISGYELNFLGTVRPIPTNEVLHHSNGRVDSEDIEGQSSVDLVSKAITNLYNVYDADNVLISNHGSIGIFTNDQKDQGGWLPLDDTEKERVQEEFKKYGLGSHQYQYLITSMSLKYQSTIANVASLQLDEKHERYRNRVLDAFKFPRDLFNSLQGATFKNNQEGEKQLYNNVIIPGANSWADELNRHFNTIQDGIIIKVSFAHVPCMQEDQLQKAQVDSSKSSRLQSEWMSGLITRNDWLVEMGRQPVNKPEFDKYIWELSPETTAKFIGFIDAMKRPTQV